MFGILLGKKGTFMDKKQFVQLCTKVFKKYGFTRRGCNYYKDLDNDILVIFGLQKSSFGDYYYVEFGFCFKSINRYMPFPAYHEANLRCGRLIVNETKTIEYFTLNEDVFANALSLKIHELIENGQKGKQTLVSAYLSKTQGNAKIIGEATLNYLGIERGNLTVWPDLE